MHVSMTYTWKTHDVDTTTLCTCDGHTYICTHTQVAADMIQMCKFSHLESGDPVPYHEIGQNRFGFGNFHSYVDNCVSTVLKVCVYVSVCLFVCVEISSVHY